jgi:maleate cis-trans isomerase
MDAIDRIERETSKPVITTTQASVWAALRMIGRTESVSGYGRLLRELGSRETQPA